jgi:hypothetical protein
MHRKHRDIIFEIEGVPACQQTFSEIDNEPAHAKSRIKKQIPSNNRKPRIKNTSNEGCTV